MFDVMIEVFLLFFSKVPSISGASNRVGNLIDAAPSLGSSGAKPNEPMT